MVHILLVTVEQLLVTVSMIVIIAAIGLIRFFNKYLFIDYFFQIFFCKSEFLISILCKLDIQMLSVTALSVPFRVVFQ